METATIESKPAKRGKLKKQGASILFLTPFTVFFLMFTIVPILSAIVLSFTYFNMVSTPTFVGFDNYIRLFFNDDVFLIALRNTAIFAMITGPISYVLSFLVAWLINEFNRTVRTILTLIFYLPSLAGNVYFVWTYIFSGDSYGFLNSVLLRLGVIFGPVQWLTDTKYMMAVVIVVILWLSLGTGFLSFVAGLQSLNRELYESAAIDGIPNRFAELWYITLPQMGPQLLFGAVMQISTSFAIGYECMNLTGFPSTDYATQTLVLHILDFGQVRFEMGYACAIAVVLFAIMLLMWKVINKVLSKWL
ncbi:MAG: sugar ABC transporter permease [Clostridia bacterium]|jgi:multiple sugar transport system permease protein|nr:sugar ABC transporter permease [Clostridia bacterium]MBR0437424.1 sugar ABC transporter permease [Clostridia bacterium]MBR3038193.1 sugar ABC transporter permease [Clostridia bacterium]